MDAKVWFIEEGCGTNSFSGSQISPVIYVQPGIRDAIHDPSWKILQHVQINPQTHALSTDLFWK